MGIRDLIIEGDSLTVQRALLELASPPPSMDIVIMGMQDSIAKFQQIGFSHVCRQGSRPAHLLAKYTKGIDDYCT